MIVLLSVVEVEVGLPLVEEEVISRQRNITVISLSIQLLLTV